MDKSSARKCGLEARTTLFEDIRKQYSRRIANKACERIQSTDFVGCYVSFRDEVDTHAILDYCFQNRIPIAVPKTVGKDLEFYKIESWEDLTPGRFGILEPKAKNQVQIENITLMFVPLSSYDEKNHRTGYGRGYYDRVLNDCKKKIGLAFSCQKVDLIEIDSWDVPLDEVITECE